MEWTLVLIVGAVIVAMLLMKRIASASPEMLRKHLAEGALVIDVRSPEEFRSFLEAEVAKWGAIVREGNIRLD